MSPRARGTVRSQDVKVAPAGNGRTAARLSRFATVASITYREWRSTSVG